MLKVRVENGHNPTVYRLWNGKGYSLSWPAIWNRPHVQFRLPCANKWPLKNKRTNPFGQRDQKKPPKKKVDNQSFAKPKVMKRVIIQLDEIFISVR